jgi:hypothetical protein
MAMVPRLAILSARALPAGTRLPHFLNSYAHHVLDPLFPKEYAWFMISCAWLIETAGVWCYGSDCLVRGYTNDMRRTTHRLRLPYSVTQRYQRFVAPNHLEQATVMVWHVARGVAAAAWLYVTLGFALASGSVHRLGSRLR